MGLIMSNRYMETMPLQPNIPNPVIERRENVGSDTSGLIFVVAFCVVIVGWSAAFILGDDFIRALKTISTRTKTVDVGATDVLFGLFVVSLAGVLAGVSLLVYHSRVFFMLLVGCFALGEIQINALNTVSFAARYVCIFVLIAAGVATLVGSSGQYGRTLGVLGLCYIGWLSVDLFVHGLTSDAASVLPMQFALMLGIFWGLRDRLRNFSDVQSLCMVLGWLGAVFTVLHTTALIFAPEPFLGGRFKSYFILPTNFADRYALLYIAMVWVALMDRSVLRKSILFSCAVGGAILLILSGTRNAAMMIVISLCVFGVVWKGKISALMAGSVAVMFVGLAVLDGDVSKLQGSVDRISKMDASNRYEVWALAWNYISQNPWIGYGLGGASDLMTKGLVEYQKATFINAHNAYMGVWLQLGFVGLGLMLIMYAYAATNGFSILFGKSISLEYKETVSLPLAIICALFFGGLFEDNLSSRGSVSQLLWGLSILLITSLSKSVQTASATS